MKAGAKALLLVLLVLLIQPACHAEQPAKENRNTEYTCEVIPLERNDISLYLDCVKTAGEDPAKNILLIYGGSDPYLNYERLSEAAASLPEGSRVTVISGGSHVVYIEKPYYREFQEALAEFLKK